jgi:antitoxin component YwqK of YwqJK toxin-antitoxin module
MTAADPNRVMMKDKDTIIYIHLYSGDKKIKRQPDKYYYWYKSRTIQITHGDYDGRLLDGDFTSFYDNKNLKVKGTFSAGLKTSKWINWYPNGEYSSIYQWKKGEKNGKFCEYNEKGELLRSGVYKNDLLNGALLEYSSDGKCQIRQYRNGEIVQPPAKEKNEEATKAVKEESK